MRLLALTTSCDKACGIDVAIPRTVNKVFKGVKPITRGNSPRRMKEKNIIKVF